MNSLNRVELIGRLGQDVELRKTSNDTSVANFSVATSENFVVDGEKKEKTQWHRIVVWGKLAELVEKYCSKGSRIYLDGRLETRKWEDKEGNTQYTTEIVAQNVIFLDSKKSSDETEENDEEETPKKSAKKPVAPAKKGKR